MDALETGDVAQSREVETDHAGEEGGVAPEPVQPVAALVVRNAAVPVGEVDRSVVGGHGGRFYQSIVNRLVDAVRDALGASLRWLGSGPTLTRPATLSAPTFLDRLEGAAGSVRVSECYPGYPRYKRRKVGFIPGLEST